MGAGRVDVMAGSQRAPRRQASAVTQNGHCGSNASPNVGLTRKPALSNTDESCSRTNGASVPNGTTMVPNTTTGACIVTSSSLPLSWKRNTAVS
jgi:hypothetical protein